MKKQTFEQLLGDNYKKVNMLTAIKEVDGVLQGKLLRRRVECLCDCGNTTTISIDHYRRGKIISCGCHLKDIMKARATHGLTKSPEYKVWQGMKGRCHNPSHVDYYNYGARGVTVSEEWRESFEVFIADMGSRPTDTSTVERVDNDKGYSKDNCMWLEKGEQNKNRRLPRKKGTSPNYEIKRESYLRRKERSQEALPTNNTDWKFVPSTNTSVIEVYEPYPENMWG